MSQQNPLTQLALPCAILLLTAAAPPISQLTLAPVYGSIPSSELHWLMIGATFSLGTLLHRWRGHTSRWISRALPVWAAWMPLIQYLLLPYSKALGPVLGPVTNGFLSCHTILIPSAYALGPPMENVDLRMLNRLPEPLRLTAVALPAFLIMEKSMASYITLLLSHVRWLTPLHLQMLLASCYSALFPSWLLFGAMPAILHAAFLNPHIDSIGVNAALQAHRWSLVDRQWSNTGYISVLESQEAGYRVMRCDHSLLGGEWLLTEDRKIREGWQVSEPIYSVFQMLEAVRLMKLDPPIRDTEAHALVVGLGIGTAPKSLVAHGVNTTVVELDPVVHAFAVKYFALPRNHTAVLQDAVSWISTTASRPDPGQYDYIIHDVFTGGAEPLQLFNTAFLENLRTLLKPNGVIAINYAGDLSLPLTRRVLHTIAHVFRDKQTPPGSAGGQCKIYRDSPPEAKDSTTDSNADFLNMVVFCRNTPGPIAFRAPTQRDFLGSRSRQHYMRPRPELEIPFPMTTAHHRVTDNADDAEILVLGDERRFAGELLEGAIRHWHIMRRVLPDAVWELW
ncbi:Hypothetical predicted protein [Lecanosticta acicola]|uniref:Uncharacterized protein n=1 Tax=Lecanosticta acicola TaxID=111012 RepID=A0AAI8Z7T6_9PEZI|nr:Hypothetical predicted protein [Lecanosticta acicola]